MATRNSFFGRGSGVYTCDVCERRTRQTGTGVDGICAECFEIAGLDNHINDNGSTLDPAEAASIRKECNALLQSIATRGGNVERVKAENTFVFPTQIKEKEPMSTSIPAVDVTAMSLSVLAAFYNTHSGLPPIKKFADRKAAEKKVAQLIATRNAISSDGNSADTGEGDMSKAKAKAPKKERKEKEEKEEKEPKVLMTPEERSKSVAKSWKNPEVAAARARRHGCIASGKPYGSVRKAFTDLGLPAGRCIPFRGRLKASGQETFEYKDDTGALRKVSFRIVEKAPKAEPTPRAKKKTKKPRKAKAAPASEPQADAS